MENNQGNDPLGSLFQTMFGGGRRRRGGRGGTTGQQWLQPGGGARPAYTPQYGPGPDGINGYDYGGQAPQYAGQYGYIWRGDQPIAYDPNLGVPQGYSVFHRGQGALNGLPGIGTPGGAGGQGYGGSPQGGQGGWGNQQPAAHGSPPPGAPWFANADGTVFANGMNAPGIGGQPGVDPNGQYYIPPGQAGGAATIPWQGSWADPSSSNFYLSQFGLATPSNYFQGGGNQGGGGQGGGGWGGGWTGGPQGPPPGGAQGGPPPMTPPGGNGPTGPSNLPSGFQMGPNGQVGNFNMYAGMPYAGGMGPYSGWLPPAVGTQVDYGAPGTAPSPMDAATAAPGTYAPGPTVQPGQYANLGMPQGGGQSGGTWGVNGSQGWGYW